MQARGLPGEVFTLGLARRVAHRRCVEVLGHCQVTSMFVQVGPDRGMSWHAGGHILHRAQPGQWPVHLAHRDSPVERHDGAVDECRQLVILLQDLRPVRLRGTRRVGVQRGDGGLGLVLPEPVPTQRPLQDRDPLGDGRRVPPRAVLFG